MKENIEPGTFSLKESEFLKNFRGRRKHAVNGGVRFYPPNGEKTDQSKKKYKKG